METIDNMNSTPFFFYCFPSSLLSSLVPVLSLYLYCGFDLSCPILEKDNFIENVYIVSSCLIKQHSFLTLFVSNEWLVNWIMGECEGRRMDGRMDGQTGRWGGGGLRGQSNIWIEQ